MNEESSIGQVIDAIKRTMQGTRYEYEVLVVDTNSKDRTREIARERGAIVVEERLNVSISPWKESNVY